MTWSLLGIIIAIPASLVALFAILALAWRGTRSVFRIDAALPTLLSIAEEFKNNGGSTLKDRLDKIDRQIEDNKHHYDVRFARIEGMLMRRDRVGR